MLHNFAKDGSFTNVYLYFIKNAKVSVNLNVNHPVEASRCSVLIRSSIAFLSTTGVVGKTPNF